MLWLETAYLIAGMLLLIGGADLLVRGAVDLSRRMGVSTLIIGLTVVAFGTSMPELGVNVLAAVQGNSGISFGNVVGSNIANVGVILGVSAAMRALAVHRSLIVREIPIMLIASVATAAMGLDSWLDGGSPDALSRVDGIVLLCLMAVFMYFIFLAARNQRQAAECPGGAAEPLIVDADEVDTSKPPMAMGWALALTAAGLAGVLCGGQLTVMGAKGIAQAFGVSDALIGLTIVAVGTSLPELATSAAAALRGHADIAVGNVVGSNVFNLLFVLGLTATITPVAVPAGGQGDLAMMLVTSFALLPMAIKPGRRITRWEGVVLVIAYAAYMTWRGWGELVG